MWMPNPFRTELREGLRKSGYIEGQNIEYAFRSANDNATLSKLAAELVALKVDVLVALYTPCALAAQQATRDIPIVTVSGDPVGLGLVASLARPGGNITGISDWRRSCTANAWSCFATCFLGAPRGRCTATMRIHSRNHCLRRFGLRARTMGIEIAPVVMVHAQDELDAAFSTARKNARTRWSFRPACRRSTSSVSHSSTACRRPLCRGRLPNSAASCPTVSMAPMHFGSAPSSCRRSCKGSKPADLPVEQPTKFELVINLRTAKTLELNIAESFLLRADAIIE